MPEMNKGQRGSGSWVSPEVLTRARYYWPEDLGDRCPICRMSMPKVLTDQGMETHPTCHRPRYCRTCGKTKERCLTQRPGTGDDHAYEETAR